MDGAVVSTDEAFPAEILLGESRKAKVMPGRLTADIAMYESVDAPKRYFLMFKYRANDPKVASEPDGAQEVKMFRQKQFEVFSDTAPANTAPNLLPAKFEIQGLSNAPVVAKTVQSGYKFVNPGASKERGVLAVYQNLQLSGQQKDQKANCVGPVLWWGTVKDRAEAQQICEDEKY
jgi:hypothetical protein